MSSDSPPSPDEAASTYDQSLAELPQRRLPQVSIRMLVAVTVIAAVGFTVIRSASDGNRWAQVATMLLFLMITTFLCYALSFVIGMLFEDRVWRSTDAPNSKLKAGRSAAKTTRWMLLISVLALPASLARADQIQWCGDYPIPKGHDYRLRVGVEMMPGPGGYQTVHFAFQPRSQAYVNDHQLSLKVASYCQFKTPVAASAEALITLRQGDGNVSHTLLVPSFNTVSELRLVLREDGRPLTNKAMMLNRGGQLNSRYIDQTMTIGIIDPSMLNQSPLFPDVRSIVSVFGNSTQGDYAALPEDVTEHRLSSADAKLLASQVQPAWVQFRVLDQFPLHPNWLSISDLDVMIVHRQFWSDGIFDQASSEMLLRWVATGGNLWVYGETASKAGSNAPLQPPPPPLSPATTLKFETMPATFVLSEKKVSDRLALQLENDTSSFDIQWNGPVYKQGNSYGNQTFKLRETVLADLKSVQNPIVKIEAAKDLAPRIRAASYGLGSVIELDDTDPFPGSLQQWMAVLDWSTSAASPMSGPVSWMDRYGLDYRSGNTNYWRFLIASVGGPPVKSFLLLNTLFVLTVGPIAYFVLRRLGKLYLLYFVAPAAALVISGGLFLFAIVSDGLGTKLRTHQWVWVDSVNEIELQQDRSTYYSALGAGELRFPDDAMVNVVMPIPTSEYSQYTGTDVEPAGRVRWIDDVQVWGGDFVPARSQIQYQVTRPRLGATARLQFMESSVKNRSSTSIGPLVYRDSVGDYWRCEQVDAGQTVVMQSASLQDVRTLIDDKVLPPVGIVPDVQSGWMSSYGYWSPVDLVPELERRLADWRMNFPKTAFVGISGCDASRFGLDEPEVAASLQIIMGQAQ